MAGPHVRPPLASVDSNPSPFVAPQLRSDAHVCRNACQRLVHRRVSLALNSLEADYTHDVGLRTHAFLKAGHSKVLSGDNKCVFVSCRGRVIVGACNYRTRCRLLLRLHINIFEFVLGFFKFFSNTLYLRQTASLN